MPQKFMHVRRVKWNDLYLLCRHDRADGKRFKPGDVVSLCASCRQVTKRGHWQEAGQVCPFCGCDETRLYRGNVGQDAAVPTASAFPILSGRVKMIAAACVLILILSGLFRGAVHVQGFKLMPDGHVVYSENGVGYDEGTYVLGGRNYTFENGALKGPCTVYVNGKRVFVNADGTVRAGWAVVDGKYAYVDANGTVTSRKLDTQTSGFRTLEGLGTVFISGDSPVNGYYLYGGEIYCFHDGLPAEETGLNGQIGENGHYYPVKPTLVQTQAGLCCAQPDGTAAAGYALAEGYAYYFDTYLRTSMHEKLDEWADGTFGTDGRLLPDRDMILPMKTKKAILTAKTGKVKTGMILLDGALYRTDEEGYLLTDAVSDSPAGRYDETGRFIPERAGVIDFEGKKYYFLADGTPADGAVLDGGKLILTDRTGLVRVSESVQNTGVTDENGVLYPYRAGVYRLGADTYCLDETGSVLTGWQNNGKLYYFDPLTGKRASGGILYNGQAISLATDGSYRPGQKTVFDADGHVYSLDSEGNVLTGTRVEDGKIMYYDGANGEKTEKTVQTGWTQLDGIRVYILENGKAASGWQLIGGCAYYFDPESGAMLTGRRTLSGTLYNFDPNGVLMPDSTSFIELDGQKICIGKNGKPQSGLCCDGQYLYWCDPQGRIGRELPMNMTGWTDARDGHIIPVLEGMFEWEGQSYYLNASGSIRTGWFAADERLYYADPETGRMKTDGREEGGRFVNGVFVPEQDGMLTRGSGVYLFINGRIASGWALWQGRPVYAEAGTGTVLKKCTKVMDGIKCVFDASGAVTFEKPVVLPIGGRYYAFTEQGTALREGTNVINGRLVYVLPSGLCAESGELPSGDSGSLRTENGFILPGAAGIVHIGDDAYCLDADGMVRTGLMTVDGKLNYFDASGRMVRDKEPFDHDGILRGNPGLYTISGQSYWMLDMYGTVGTGLIMSPEGELRYADESGVLQSGYIRTENGRYYFADSSQNYTAFCNTFVYAPDGNVYYALNDCTLAVGWVKFNESIYYFDAAGRMLTDTIIDGIYVNKFGAGTYLGTVHLNAEVEQ